jgi:elongation factor Ts
MSHVGESLTMSISAQQVKELRDLTGAGMMDSKRALEESGGDLEKAREWLRTKGLADAAKRAGKTAREGVVEAYVHLNGRLGVLIEVNSETDFVANTDEFKTLARDLAKQVAASPHIRWITRDEVPEDEVANERKLFEEQAREEGKPDHVIDRIVDGKLESFYERTVLLDIPFLFTEDEKKTGEVVADIGAKVGENIVVRRFAKFVRGEE